MKTLLLILVMALSGCGTVREIGYYARDVLAVSGPAAGRVINAACTDVANMFEKEEKCEPATIANAR